MLARCFVCACPFDSAGRAPRRTPCCKHLVCSACVEEVLAPSSPQKTCSACAVQLRAGNASLAAFPVDVPVISMAHAAVKTEYVYRIGMHGPQ